ncbi:hypothetical protein PHYSODRAFT_319474 [Phytophthora sojae]|uniref:Peptidase S74 domain-containing protein n=1 Tax=Phytophthora sojae (strain P6497) TaxID=1094619 RepID=G5ACW9_PHYSP|nr:hypothetical protein PHYSODRAFT_319474 [Phytophthora sojae]EGZ06631.1 hypothetical protein PHYSODRAFT_319474 [Phytophthora sojae]|eukprot:XP_009537395.1 hypothetical protein PHYSODRAFT_319474 [Phytophthora sojae]
MPLGTSSTNNLRFYGGTANRETMNIYRTSDSNGLVIASRTTSGSNNKSYPLLNLISTDNPSLFVGGVSATTADLFTINWNDKPTVGFTSQTHRFCFNVGNGQPYKSGYPRTFGFVSTADALSLSPGATSALPNGNGCLYLVNDTIDKMIFNTNTPYTSSFGTAPITLSQGNIYIKASNALNDGSANYDMPIFMESSNASPIGFGLQLSNATNATSTNSAYFGTTTGNDLVLMTTNTRRVTVSSTGRVGIGTGSPPATLHVSGSNSYTVGVGGTSNCYQYNVQGNIWSNLGLGPVSVTVSAIFSSSIFCVQSIYTSSDRRLKENITPISITLDHYDKLEPVSCNWKGETKAKLGLIAQDAMKVCGEMVSIMPNENMKEEGDNDLEGYQYTLDYSQLGALNAAAIKLLIKNVNELEKNYLNNVQFR